MFLYHHENNRTKLYDIILGIIKIKRTMRDIITKKCLNRFIKNFNIYPVAPCHKLKLFFSMPIK